MGPIPKPSQEIEDKLNYRIIYVGFAFVNVSSV